ncbi:MAG: hypothetical protein ACREA3_09755 [Nitrosotalea sp.]
MVDVIKAIEQFLLPQLNEIKGEIKALDTKIDSLEKIFKAEINSVRVEVKAIAERMDIVKEMEQFKSRLAQLEARR